MRALVTIYHPATGATSVVPATAVPTWLRSGWTTEPASESDATNAPPARGDDTGDVEPDAPTTPAPRRPASGSRSSSSTSTEE